MRTIGLLILLCMMLIIGSRYYFSLSKTSSSTLTVHDLVTQTWQAQTRMANAISTVQHQMLGGESPLLESTGIPAEYVEGTLTPSPTTIFE